MASLLSSDTTLWGWIAEQTTKVVGQMQIELNASVWEPWFFPDPWQHKASGNCGEESD